MLKQHIRQTILDLSHKGMAVRAIARSLKISRNAVKHVLGDGQADVPRLERAEKADPHRDQILELYSSFEGNRVLVHKALEKAGADLGYSTLTAWLKREGIGPEQKPPAGRYHFEPGKEMQHDTSPFHAPIGGVEKSLQIASEVLCYSRLLFFQCYPRFRRFECKCFLTDAAQYVDGVCERCMIDNTHVVVLHGTGRDMVPVPEMVAFSERLGNFSFAAHEIGDANRSARVEGHFAFIQKNFFPGRSFRDWADLNAQARQWCDEVNASYSPKLHASRRELFALEKTHLHRLPAWLPEVYQLHQRIVDLEGYIHVDTNIYSAPWRLVGKALEVRETKDKVELYDGPRCVASHQRVPEPSHHRVTLPEHRPPRGQGPDARKVLPDEAELRRVFPEAASYLALLKRKSSGRYARDVRRLLRFIQDYPRPPIEKAVTVALQYGLCDLDRLERLVLREIASDFFLVPGPETNHDR